MSAALFLALAGCHHRATYTPPVLAIPPADAPIPREGGPIAGPHAVVDRAPPPPVPEGIPGGGPLQPYLAQVRVQVNALVSTCLATGGATVSTGPALMKVRIGGDGAVLEAALVRSSGSPHYDSCLLQAFRTVHVKAPPPEILGPDGQLAPPEMAFR